MTYAGYAVRVPATWKTVDLSKLPICDVQPNTVNIGVPKYPYQCGVPEWPYSSAPSVRIEVRSPAGSPRGLAKAASETHNGLHFREPGPGATPLKHEMGFIVTGGRGGKQILLTVGLGFDAALIRGIIGSLRSGG